jgi:16S rRNA (guanine527-N7)-methyltransferase
VSFLPVDLLRNGACELGIELTDEQIDQLDRFASLLVETNKTLNLTRITEPEAIVTEHYLDSFTCLAASKIKTGARVIDVGAGAGFPGIPIKIVRPDLKMTLLDSSRKKLKFIEDAIAVLSDRRGEAFAQRSDDTTSCIANASPLQVSLVHARAEEAGRAPAHRETYNVAFARALADMKTLAELCLPLVKVGGVLIAQKSEGTDEEIEAAKPLIGQLGGKIEKIARIAIPGTDITRRLVVVWKANPTPPEFPRAFSRIARTRK